MDGTERALPQPEWVQPLAAAARVLQRWYPARRVTLEPGTVSTGLRAPWTDPTVAELAEAVGFGDRRHLLAVEWLSRALENDDAQVRSELIEQVAGLLRLALGSGPDPMPDRLEPLIIFVAQELVSTADFGADLIQVAVADSDGRPADDELHLLSRSGDATLRLAVTAAGSGVVAGSDDVGTHLADLAELIGALAPWNNNGDCLRFETVVVAHGLDLPVGALPSAGGAERADALAREWWATQRPWQAVDIVRGWEDTECDIERHDPRPLDPAGLEAQLAEVERETAAAAFTTFDIGEDGADWQDGADRQEVTEASDALRRRLGGLLCRDLFDTVRRHVTTDPAGEPLLAYRLGLPAPLQFGSAGSAGVLLLVGPQRAGIVAIDGSV